MFRFSRKNLVKPHFLAAAFLFVLLASPSLRRSVADNFKHPLSLFNFVRREAGALIFYRRNFFQNKKLKTQIGLLKYKLDVLREMELENQRLHKLLSLKQSLPLKLVPAKVIARSSENWSSAVIIDKGSRYGVKSGMPVITFAGLAGRVVDVTASTSKVVLISDPSLSVAALVQRSRQEGVVCGTLGAGIIMKYLSEDADIKAGDSIISSGLNKTYPKGLFIGEVIEVSRQFSGLSCYALVRPAVNLFNIEEVLVVIQ